MRRPKIQVNHVVASGINIAALYAVSAGWLGAFQMSHVDAATRVLACLSIIGLADGLRVHPAIRETGLMLLRGGTVTALFLASTDFGPAPAQVRRSGQELFAAALLGFLVLLAQARRAAEAKQDRQVSESMLREIITILQAPAVPTASPPLPVRPAGVALARESLVVAGLAVALLARMLGAVRRAGAE